MDRELLSTEPTGKPRSVPAERSQYERYRTLPGLSCGQAAAPESLSVAYNADSYQRSTPSGGFIAASEASSAVIAWPPLVDTRSLLWSETGRHFGP